MKFILVMHPLRGKRKRKGVIKKDRSLSASTRKGKREGWENCKICTPYSQSKVTNPRVRERGIKSDALGKRRDVVDRLGEKKMNMVPKKGTDQKARGSWSGHTPFYRIVAKLDTRC